VDALAFSTAWEVLHIKCAQLASCLMVRSSESAVRQVRCRCGLCVWPVCVVVVRQRQLNLEELTFRLGTFLYESTNN